MTPKFAVKLTFTALAAVAVASLAFGAGEPKNRVPAGRHSSARPHAVRVTAAMAGIVPAGEAKNEAPFTARYNADPGYASALRKAARMAVA